MAMRAVVILLSIFLAILFLSASALAQAADGKIKLITKEIHIGEKGEVAPRVRQEGRSQPGMGYVEPADLLDAEELGKYDWIMSGTPVLSPDKKRMGYVAMRDGSTVAVVDGVEQKAYYDIGTPPLFSPDSKRVAYAAERENKSVIVVDGIEGKEYDQIMQNPIFSPDSKRVAYLAERDGRQFAVMDEVEQKGYKRVTGLMFSPDGQRLAYVARRSDGKHVVVVDGDEGKGYERLMRPKFSPDSKRMAYTVRHLGKWTIAVDGAEGKEQYDRIFFMVFSPNNERLAYIAVRDDKYFVGLAGEVYRIKRGGKMVAVATDKIQGKGQYDQVYGPVFSPDSKRLTLAAIRDGRSFVVVDGIEQTEYDQVGFPQFSPDSRWIVYSAKRGDGWFFVVNGIEGAQYENPFNVVSLMFSSASGNLDDFHTIRIPGKVTFDPEDPAKFHVPIVRGQDIFRLEVEIVEE